MKRIATEGVLVRLEPADKDALLRLADRWGCSMSAAIRRLIREAERKYR